MSLIGSAKIMISAQIIGTAFAMKNFFVLRQLEGMVLSQNSWTGLHEKTVTSSTAIPQQKTKAPTILVAMARLPFRKNRGR